MKKIYSLFDTVSEQYGNPFISINDKVAMRSVEQFLDDSFRNEAKLVLVNNRCVVL